jgi:hypothetical protein
VADGRRTFALGEHGLRRLVPPRPDWPSTPSGCLNGKRLVGPVGRYGGAPTFVGHWRSIERSPDGRTLLLQWSAECEVPVAYFAKADGSRLRRVSRDPAANTVALGWTRSGEAVVAFPKGACGSTLLTAGTYRVDLRTRRATLVFRGFGALWG